jgi:cyclophilin family peptidyl-prolyl cis-trans isomerase
VSEASSPRNAGERLEGRRRCENQIYPKGYLSKRHSTKEGAGLAKKRKKCPFCGAEVNKDNFNRHFLKVHGDLDERDFKIKGYKKPIGLGGKKTRKVGKRESKKGYKITNTRRNAVIAVIVMIVIVSLVGALMYQNLDQNGEPTDEITNNGNGGGNMTIATMTTTLGTIKIELNTVRAPATAQNFIDLANSGFYNGIIFHRVIPGFVIQGGGFISDGTTKNSEQIPWENTGLHNTEYSISMARSGDANSESDSGTGSSQFFINLVDNHDLDSYSYPYVVFGRVIEGFSVVDAIGALPTGTYNGMSDWPDDPPVITSIVI